MFVDASFSKLQFCTDLRLFHLKVSGETLYSRILFCLSRSPIFHQLSYFFLWRNASHYSFCVSSPLSYLSVLSRNRSEWQELVSTVCNPCPTTILQESICKKCCPGYFLDSQSGFSQYRQHKSVLTFGAIIRR